MLFRESFYTIICLDNVSPNVYTCAASPGTTGINSTDEGRYQSNIAGGMTVMNLITALIAILIITLSALGIALTPLSFLLTAILPYTVFAVFIAGFIYRVVKWAKTPVPFRITTTCGQQTSLPWIKCAPLESPSGIAGVI